MNAAIVSATTSNVSPSIQQGRGSYSSATVVSKSSNLQSTTVVSSTLTTHSQPAAQLLGQQVSVASVDGGKSAMAVDNVNLTGSFSLKSGPMTIAAVLQQPGQGSTVNNRLTNINATAIKEYQPVTQAAKSLSQVNSELPTLFGEPNQSVVEQATPQAVSDIDNAQAVVDEQADTQDEQKNTDQREQVSKQIEQKQQLIEQAEAQQIAELAKRDSEVKTHEQAHAAVGGSYAQSPRYEYEKGPDGRRYAVDGEVSIDVSIVSGDPQATINKMQKVYAAAMAPVQPSMADIRVAAQALQNMNEAKQALAVERQESVMSIEDSEQLTQLGNVFNRAENSDPLAPFMKDSSKTSDNQLEAITLAASQSRLTANKSVDSLLRSSAAGSVNELHSSTSGSGQKMFSQNINAERYNPYQNQQAIFNSNQSGSNELSLFV
ncbi:hypothetical protein GCM10011607_06610 [Shewanella inventionis]|uniref:Catalase n=1 Tax=Shewanella inventionis TaxID=1738770 RepID=A0ABQ1IP34_9GAMM|nr:putative metalloprotease CJM1_0395 family protein [Shewanella inventionis]MCL1157219.1 hypothetical protein [Shewanella inventionis]GGB48934.1 hypothetical protein GCM10011607_06610 [Shewanella inventionis]